MENQAEYEKIAVLAEHLGCEPDDISVSSYDDCLFEYGSQEYLVCDDAEADKKAEEHISDSIWAFNASFLVGYMPEGIDEEVIQIIQQKCESANAPLSKMMTKPNTFVEDAISADGRGHFLSGYDGEEIETYYERRNGVHVEKIDYYIYRTN